MSGDALRPGIGLLVVLTLAGCRRPSDATAVHIVQNYNRALIEAYRTSDAQLMEGLVGDEEARKLTGLIGVKYDMGLTLDASLRGFEVLSVARPEGSVVIHTEERWHYRDRRIGSGATVGQESDDHYFMAYTLKPARGRWLVWRVRFDREPVVSRQQVPNQGDPGVFHGSLRPSESPALRAAPGQPGGKGDR